MMGGEVAKLELSVKDDDPYFDLEKAVCSHGLFMMAPNRWDPTTKTLTRPLRISSSSSSSPPLIVSISQPSPSHPLILVKLLNATSLSSFDHQSLLGQVRRMLRIPDEGVMEFQKLHPEFKERGVFGRVFRSPTLFEDMVKCILLCNCQWSRTLSMARALCQLQHELQQPDSKLEDFHPKTPQSREIKRKSGRGKKAVVKLETKFCANEYKFSGYAKTPQGNELFKSNDTSLHLNSQQDDSSASFTILGDFPSPEELANLKPEYLAKRCGLGYRADRIVLLAQSIVDGTLQLGKLEQLCGGYTLADSEEIDEQLSKIHGFGPFTRANVLMCMGFYGKIPADSETVRHLNMAHKRRCTIRSVQEELEAIYGEYAPFQFLAYWSELWDCYERRFGKLSEMPHSDYQLINGNNMKNKASKRKRTNLT